MSLVTHKLLDKSLQIYNIITMEFLGKISEIFW